ncbi:hypothetical protein [Piscirickettsia litoralis]|uniref:hypothetical protein n=1 Tax=Piscirickettsia litoralis TaxID=1891921 RepID=UPI001301769F|nr:hypothetical protein [Piscirickettsia litoralis]
MATQTQNDKMLDVDVIDIKQLLATLLDKKKIHLSDNSCVFYYRSAFLLVSCAYL